MRLRCDKTFNDLHYIVNIGIQKLTLIFNINISGL